MEKTLKVLNDLEKEGVIKSYALGGATALLFYAEPALTYDVDVFVFLAQKQTSQLIDLSSLYEALKNKGYQAEQEHVIIEGIPVQFIPVYNSLIEESLKGHETKEYQTVATKVVSLEHLLAIMLQTNRAKDRERIGRLLEEGVAIDQDKLVEILTRHQLLEKWEKISAKKE